MKDIVVRITKAGDAGLRAVLYEATTVTLHRAGPNWLKAWALRLAKAEGQQARNRCARPAYRRRASPDVRDGAEFRYTREEAMAVRAA